MRGLLVLVSLAWASGGLAAEPHWAFAPLRPASVNATVDYLLAAQRSARQVPTAAPADKATLLRRVTFDLIGLPPTLAEVDAFLRDDRPDAFAQVVERLLASPHYGERWGRHWLDVARYADSRGAPNNERLPFAYTYRDWVVRALNADLPFDQFVVQQLAADQLKLGPNHPDLAALGWLTVGRSFGDNDPDIIDDQLDVIGRGLLGLSLSCARCHDHPYDAIPTADYYSLYGVFAGTTRTTTPLFTGPADAAQYAVYAQKLRAAHRQHRKLVATFTHRIAGDYTRYADRYLLAVQNLGDQAADEPRSDGLLPRLVVRYKETLEASRAEWHPVWGPWHAFAGAELDQYAELAKQFAKNTTATRPVNQLVAKLFAGPAPTTLAEVAERYAGLLERTRTDYERAVAQADQKDVAPPTQLQNAAANEIAELVALPGAALRLTEDDLREFLDEGRQQKLADAQTAIDTLLDGPDTPPHAHLLRDPDEPGVQTVFRRGKADQPGAEVPRQFLSVLAGPQRQPFTPGTGRLELARALTTQARPLLARVWVNRVWRWHMGQGLVETPSDFGTRGSPPTHPELLDWLADQFVQKNFSTKHLHRLIVLSQTYQQSSRATPELLAADPDNRWLSRMNRQRLSVEAVRDALLHLGGTLDLQVGGRPVALAEPRRTLYVRVMRGELPGLFTAFDFANPDLHNPGRHETTTAPQALFLLNSPLVAEQSRRLGEQTKVAPVADAVQHLYRTILHRPATAAEVTRSTQFLTAAEKLRVVGAQPPPTVWRYGHAKWDDEREHVSDFTPLAHFADGLYRTSGNEPNAALASLILTAEGGHPGTGRVIVRRWVAPAAGKVNVTGTLAHSSEGETDGVRGRIVTANGSEASFLVNNQTAPTNPPTITVAAGATIDFVVDSRESAQNDAFIWPVTLELTQANGRVRTFESQDDFAGPPATPAPPLSPRAKLAQVLLASNEFIYVD